MRAFSYGGGVQSTAALVLAGQGKIDYPVFLFANVGEDSEHPKTLAYVRAVAAPLAVAYGIQLVEVRATYQGRPESILERLQRRERSLFIPVRMANGRPGRRGCTADFKIRVIARWLRAHGASRKEPVVTGLGISLDEIHRARTDSGIAWQRLEYPLLDLGLTRADCINLIEAAGVPVPPKSSCWFCPFHRRAEWVRMRREEPELFARAVVLEEMLNLRRRALGKDAVFLHASARPLAQAVGEQPLLLEGVAVGSGVQSAMDAEACEAGYCMV